LAYVHPVATVFSAVPVAMMDTINATARTEEKEEEEGYECTYYLSQITPDRDMLLLITMPLFVLIH
jgi:hypothetical protein